ncbi:MAG TPA: hypothetical protein VIN77_12885 [Aurantimonas sp.]|uniref:Uncharacterized protein n=1 Tax=Aurantimonas marianensis TaxID=2920428 RepID=A0A9X2H9A4_9HYPH|nr:hypothetical protein [Aurantimonas marianensis]MCP3056143.1 hypothetical protein [Aurantimonas marianensis]
MPDLDTDPAMMREQQDRDTPQALDGGLREHSDSDDASRADREAAKAGPDGTPASVSASGREDGQEAANGGAGLVAMRNAVLTRSMGLVRKGRSLLGN